MQVEVSQYEAASGDKPYQFVFRDPPVLAEVIHWQVVHVTNPITNDSWPETYAVVAYLPSEASGPSEYFQFETLSPWRLRIKATAAEPAGYDLPSIQLEPGEEGS